MNFYTPFSGVEGYTPPQMRGAFNQQMAEAHASGDPRYNTKPLDRAGMSRGAGQAQMAGIAAAQSLADGVAQAYGRRAQDTQANAVYALADAGRNEQLGQDTMQLIQQQRYADALASLQRQQTMGSGVLGGLLGGQGLTNFLGY